MKNAIKRPWNPLILLLYGIMVHFFHENYSSWQMLEIDIIAVLRVSFNQMKLYVNE